MMGQTQRVSLYPRGRAIAASPSHRLVVQHQLTMLEVLDREELQGLLFQHRTPVMFPASQNDWPNHNPVIIGQTSPDELLNQRGACVHNDVLPRFPLQTSDDSIEISLHYPRVLPIGLLQGVREDDLLSTI